MTTLQLSDRDKDMLRGSASRLLDRRRQMCPWPLDRGGTERLYIARDVWHAGRTMRDRGYGPMLNEGVMQRIIISKILGGNDVKLQLECTMGSSLWSSNTRNNMQCITGTPEYEKLHAWLQTAVRIKVENEIVASITARTIAACTTYLQLARALPHSLQALAAHHNSPTVSREWQHSSARKKLTAVMQELDLDAKSRARKLNEDILRVIGKHKETIETTFSTAVMLPNYYGLEQGSAFENTWFKGDLI